MCGIIGYIGDKQAKDIILEGLKDLEYRGYDSVGIALQQKDGSLSIQKSIETQKKFARKLRNFDTDATIGIGHTRWATHGAKTKINAHPHTNEKGTVTLVHNGIITNHKELKSELVEKGYRFTSQTDTEVAVHLFTESLMNVRSQSLSLALIETAKKIQGENALVFIMKDFEGIFGISFGKSLYVGMSDKEYFLSSDIVSLDGKVTHFFEIPDMSIFILTNAKYEVFDECGMYRDISIEQLGKELLHNSGLEGFAHYMMKEIYEQPAVLQRIVNLRRPSISPFPELEKAQKPLRDFNTIHFVACGTSYHAGLIGKRAFEDRKSYPVSCEISSECKSSKIREKSLLIAISQSGGTSDTYEVLQTAKKNGAQIISLVNAPRSKISRASDATIPIDAGHECAVASTKTFTAEALLLILFSLGYSYLVAEENAILALPETLRENIERIDHEVKNIVRKYVQSPTILFIGRDYNYPIALEGALKLKEITYIPAIPCAAGELKHGTLALVDKHVPTIAIAVQDESYERNLTSIQEIKTREGRVIAIATEGDDKIQDLVDDVIYVPATLDFLYPILTVIPLQLFAYYMAVERGLDPDHPRNLAKCVTVE